MRASGISETRTCHIDTTAVCAAKSKRIFLEGSTTTPPYTKDDIGIEKRIDWVEANMAARAEKRSGRNKTRKIVKERS